MEAIISVLGSIASILGAYWAFRESKKAINAAKAVNRARQEIMDRREIAELAQLHNEIKRILRLVAKVGPTSTSQYMKGLNCAEIAREVEVFIALILERRSHYSGSFADRATELRNNLKEDIEGLAEARSFEDKKRFGKNIYYKIENFIPVVKELSDAKQGQTSIT